MKSKFPIAVASTVLPSAVAVCSAAVILCGSAQALTFNFTDEYYVSTAAQLIFGSIRPGHRLRAITVPVYTRRSIPLLRPSPSCTPIPVPVTSLFLGSLFRTPLRMPVRRSFLLTGTIISLERSRSRSTMVAAVSLVQTTTPAALSFSTCSITGVTTSTGTFTGGTVIAFTFNSIDFNSNVFAIGATIEGLLNGVVEDTFTGSINTGGLWQTHSFNWTDIDEVLIQ